MKNIFSFVFSLYCNIFNGQSLFDNKNFNLIHEDNFNFFDNTYWIKHNYQKGDLPSNFISERIKNVDVKNGYLELNSFIESTPGFTGSSFTVGQIGSVQMFFPDNFFEIKYKIPQGKHVFPAFWMWTGGCNTYREIDFMEYIGKEKLSNYALIRQINCNHDALSNGNYSITDIENFHISTGRLTTQNAYSYLDGNLVGVMPININIFSQGINIQIDNFVHSWTGDPIAIEPNFFPNKFVVDYFKVFQIIKDCQTQVTQISNFNTFNWGLKKSYSLDGATQVPIGNNAVLLATDKIEFNPEFEIKQGAALEAGIMPCN